VCRHLRYRWEDISRDRRSSVDDGPTCSRTSSSRGRPSDHPGELIGGDSGVRASGRRNFGALALWGITIGSSVVVGAVAAARTSLPPAVAEFVTAFGGGVLLAAIALGSPAPSPSGTTRSPVTS
jgi:hypothetical protein